MTLQSLIVSLLIATAVINLFFAFSTLYRKLGPGSRAFSLMLISASVYSIGYAMELTSPSLELIFRALKIEYIGLSFFPMFWLVLAMQISGRFTRQRRYFHTVLLIISLATLIMVVTNNYHHFYYRDMYLNLESPFPLVVLEKGPWYYVFTLYIYVCILHGNILLFYVYRESVSPFRRQALMVMLVSLIPWIGSIIYEVGLIPFNLDINPLTLGIAGPILGLAASRLQIFKITPVARKLVFAELAEPVLVLTSEGILADFNAASVALFPSLQPVNIGRRINDVPGIPSDLVKFSKSMRNDRILIHLEHKDGTRYYQIRKTWVQKDDKKEGIILMLTDLTNQIELQRKLENLAARDSLTNVFNRRYFWEVAESELQRSSRSGRPVALIMIDLDHFKRINDSFGHVAGDQILVDTAGCLESNLRNFDILGRYGGEEFIVLLPETNIETGALIAERLRLSLDVRRLSFQGRELQCTASFGVSALLGEGTDLSCLINAADRALYKAKQSGRNRVCID